MFGFIGDMYDNVARGLGLSNADAVEAGQASIDQLMEQANAISQQNRGLYGNYLDEMKGIYGQGAGQYATAVDNLVKAIGEGPQDFSYTGDVNDFYDKFANQRQQAAMNAMQNSGAANGSRWSSDFMNSMANKQAALSTEAWQQAYDNMMRDRSQQLQEWQAGQSNRQNYISNLGTVAGLYGNDRNQLADAYGNYYGNLASQNNADLQTQADLTMGRTNLGMQKDNGFGAILNFAGNVIGGLGK